MASFSSVDKLSLYSLGIAGSPLAGAERSLANEDTSSWCTRLRSLRSRATPEPIHDEQTSHAAAVTVGGVSAENAGLSAAPTCDSMCYIFVLLIAIFLST